MIFPLLLLLHKSEAQSCFANVQLDRSSVYVQQPFKVTITVLTATWYTAPIEFDNLQVPNAFVLPFSRTIPGMFDHNGEQYAGIQFYFIVFPYKPGKFTIPPITVHATTPPKGSSESRRTTIKTPARHFTVKEVPENVKGDWLVAKSVAIQERWNKPLSNLKVGDVVERTVTVHARGTLPQFIPPLHEQNLDFANVYPQDPELRDTRNDYDANGELTQTFIYLMEKAGDFTIPSMKVQWWNPSAGKLNARSLRSHKLHINENPNLGMVASIRDSLNVAQQPTPMGEAAKTTKTIFGIKWYWFTIYTLFALVVLNIVVRLLARAIRSVHKKYMRYRTSEKYWFRHLMRSSSQLNIFWPRLYQWWDRDQKNRTPDIFETALEYGNTDLEKALDEANARLYHEGGETSKSDFGAKRWVRSFRHWLLRKEAEDQTKVSERQKEWTG